MLATIEIPTGSIYKYEIKDGALFLDRALTVTVPYNYGYTPEHVSEDGDFLDVFVVSLKPLESLCSLNFEPHYMISMQDQGLEDNKLVGCIEGEEPPSSKDLHKIISYLKTYKKGVTIGDIKFLGGKYEI